MIYLFLSDLAVAPGPLHLSDLPGQSAGLPPDHPGQCVAPGHPLPHHGSPRHPPADQLAAPPEELHHHPGGGQGQVPPAQCSHPADDSLRPGAGRLVVALRRPREVPQGEVGVPLSVGQVHQVSRRPTQCSHLPPHLSVGQRNSGQNETKLGISQGETGQRETEDEIWVQFVIRKIFSKIKSKLQQ